jgi:hypothetical protein
MEIAVTRSHRYVTTSNVNTKTVANGDFDVPASARIASATQQVDRPSRSSAVASHHCYGATVVDI